MTDSKAKTAKDGETNFQLPFGKRDDYLKTVIDSVQAGIVIIDAETRQIADANPAALQMIGAARDDVIGSICHQFICPAAQGQCPICDLGQSVDNSERVLLTAQGNVTPIIKNVVTTMLEGRKYLVESFVSIENQKLYQSSIDGLPQNVYRIDQEGRVTFGNKTYLATLGMTLEECLGKTAYDFFPKDLADKYTADDKKVMETGEAFDSVEGHKSSDAKEMTYVRTIKIPIRNAAGNIIGLQGVFWDVSQRIQVEQMLGTRAAELEAVAQVSIAISTILDTTELLQTVVDLTKERFNLYHAHIYLLDDITSKLNLTVGADEVGREMTAQGWSIPLNREHSLVARAARTRQGVVANDVRQEPDFFPNPLLPDTRSELAVPLIVGGTVLGVLDVQAAEVNHFSDQDVRIQSTLAAQVAVALQNARLFIEQEKNSRLLQERVKGLNCLNDIGQEIESAPPISQFLQWVTERVPPAMQYSDVCVAAIEFGGQVYGVPEAIKLPTQVAYGLYIGGQLEGRLYTAYTEKRDFINEESAMLGAVATRVSGYIENLRLSEQTQHALDLTERLYEAGHRLNTAEDLQAAVAAVLEAVPASEVNRAVLFMFEQNQAGENETATVLANWHSGEGTLPTLVGTQYQWAVIQAFQFAVGTEPFFFDDTFNDDRVDAGAMAVFKQQNIRSLAALPIWAGGRQLGTLLIEAEEVHHFTSEEIDPYIALAGQLAVFIDRQQLFEQTQAALEEANLLRRAVEQSLDGSAVADMDGNLLFANLAWAKMHGCDTEEELLGKPLSIFHTEEQLQNEVAPFNAQVMQQGAHQGEVGHKRKDGTAFPTWMTVALLQDTEGNPIGLAAAAQDITHRKQAEEALRESEATSIALVKAIPDLVFRINKDGINLAVMSAEDEAILEEPDELIGRSLYDSLPADLAEQRMHYITQALETGETQVYEYQLDLHGKLLDEEARIVPIGEDEVILFVRDITDRKAGEAERERLLTEVEDAYRQYVRQEWEQFLGEQQQDVLRIEVQSPGGGNGAAIETPIILRGQAIGSLKLEDTAPERAWSEDEKALVDAISEQLALTVENLRLFEDTQQRATREQLTRQITDKMRAAPDIDSIIESGLSALAGALNVPRAYVKLTSKLEEGE